MEVEVHFNARARAYLHSTLVQDCTYSRLSGRHKEPVLRSVVLLSSTFLQSIKRSSPDFHRKEDEKQFLHSPKRSLLRIRIYPPRSLLFGQCFPYRYR